MTSVSDMIKQLEVKASKYDELISDLSELLSKYNANSNPKEELVHVDEKWMEAFNKCQKWELEDRGENWVWKTDLMKKYGEINHISNRGTLNNRFNKTAKIMFDHTKQGIRNFVRPRGYEPSKDTEVESENNNIEYQRTIPLLKVDILDYITEGQIIDIKSKSYESDLLVKRIKKIVSYYEIPLKFAKHIARYSSWEDIAQSYLAHEKQGHRIGVWKSSQEFENANDYQYEYTCSESSEGRGSRVHRKTDSKGRKRKKPCGQKGIHTTKQPITSVSNHQAYCKKCGNKPRLNPGNVRLLGWRVV